MTDDNNTSNSRLLLHVLVIAHPDDESLFFIPTIRNLQQQQQQQQQADDSNNVHQKLWLLCLTNGNYNGLGKVRTKEVFETCQTILKLDHVILLEEGEDIFDDPHTAWHIPRVATCIQTALEKAILHKQKNDDPTKPKPKITISFLTFDEQGVSGHINHRDTYQAVRYLLQRQARKQQQMQKDDSSLLSFADVWTLETETNLFYKYIPVYSWFLLICSLVGGQQSSSSTTTSLGSTDNNNNNSIIVTYRLHQPWLNWKAMASHASQFVWYRRLFVVFSCYTYVNRLQRMSQTMATTSTSICSSKGQSHEKHN